MAKSNRTVDVLVALQGEKEFQPELAETIEFHSRLLDAIEAAAKGINISVPSPDTVTMRLNQGDHLLQMGDLELEWDSLAFLFDEVVRIIESYRPDLADALAEFRDVPRDAPDAFKAMVDDFLASGQTHDIKRPDADDGLSSFILSHTLHPFLVSWADALAPLVDDTQWYRSYCPVCGSQPDLAALEKDVPGRTLLCSSCDTEWVFKRVGCPYCGNDDHSQLAYHPSEDGSYRLYVCEVCKSYLKTVDRRERWRLRPLPVERIITVGMDLAAIDAGYVPGSRQKITE